MRNPKIIVITGANSGIGSALALYYAAEGVTLHLHGRNLKRLEQTADQCRGQGANVSIKSGDICDAEAVKEWLVGIDAQTPIDLLIANAGISGGKGGHAVLGEEPAQVRRIMAVNVDGVINSVTPLIAPMAERKHGQIAVMSSLVGFRGLPSAPAYSASKMAVRAYGEALRGWLGKHGVKVSVICPGYVRTPLTSKNPFPMPMLMEPEKAAKIIARGLRRNTPRIVFPWPMYAVIWLVTHLLPLRVSDPLFAILPDKPANKAI